MAFLLLHVNCITCQFFHVLPSKGMKGCSALPKGEEGLEINSAEKHIGKSPLALASLGF